MPAGDGTGPMGQGPMTGRAAGFCAGFGRPGFMNAGGRGGFAGGRGRGFGGGGRGWRNRFWATGLTGWQRAAMGQGGFGQVPPAGPAVPPAAPITGQQELDALKAQADYFTDALEGIRRRIDEIESDDSAK